MKPTIFISYRVQDSADITARLCDRLRHGFGAENVFRDVDDIVPGQDFTDIIETRIRQSTLMLVVIGPNWGLNQKEPRSAASEVSAGSDVSPSVPPAVDYVRREIEMALRIGLPILPVLVNNTPPLSAQRLPATISRLAAFHAAPLRSGLDFETDIRRIIDAAVHVAGTPHRMENMVAGRGSLTFSPPMESAVSKRRSFMLDTLRFTAVIATISLVFKIFQWLASTTIRFDKIGLLPLHTWIVMVIACVGILSLVLIYIRMPALIRVGAERQRLALEELSQLILGRLESPSLLSYHSVRSLAVSLENKYRCAIITDKLAAEAVRAAALELEHRIKGEPLRPQLERLNTLMLSFDQYATPLCSVAVVDRLGAYVHSQYALLAVLTAGLTACAVWAVSTVPESSFFPPLALCGAAASICALLLLSTHRAIGFWKNPHSRIKPNILADFFLVVTLDRSKWTMTFINTLWAPLWEHFIFISNSQRELSLMHEFRFHEARRLWKEMIRTDIELDDQDPSIPINTVMNRLKFKELAQKLWIVTGEPVFRDIEAHGRVRREDRQRGTVGVL